MNGLVLAGGQSTRMGKDKALIDYHGEPQYSYLYRLLTAYCDQVYISSKEKKYTLPSLIDMEEYSTIGPIAGLLTAFQHDATDWLVLAIDYPFIGESEIKKLLEPSEALAHVFYNPHTDFFEPFLGYYKKEFMPLLLREIESGAHSMQHLLRKSKVKKLIPENVEIIKSIDFPQEF